MFAKDKDPSLLHSPAFQCKGWCPLYSRGLLHVVYLKYDIEIIYIIKKKPILIEYDFHGQSSSMF